jgi:hypothetical protein
MGHSFCAREEGIGVPAGEEPILCVWIICAPGQVGLCTQRIEAQSNSPGPGIDGEAARQLTAGYSGWGSGDRYASYHPYRQCGNGRSLTQTRHLRCGS